MSQAPGGGEPEPEVEEVGHDRLETPDGFETGASAPSSTSEEDDAPSSTSEEDDAPSSTSEEDDAPSSTSEEDDAENDLKAQLDERTADLQRLQAEFVNYKRRVDRDRELVRENATYTALMPIIDVLDTIDRAREHGPLEGGFKAVAEQLERVVSGVGLTKFGAVGDAFDPTIHEALSHIGEDPEVEVTTCKVVAKAGYQLGGRVVRAAQVLVVDPPTEPAAGPTLDEDDDIEAEDDD